MGHFLHLPKRVRYKYGPHALVAPRSQHLVCDSLDSRIPRMGQMRKSSDLYVETYTCGNPRATARHWTGECQVSLCKYRGGVGISTCIQAARQDQYLPALTKPLLWKP